MRTLSKFKSGFTLIEAVVYLFILGLMTVVVISLLVSMSKSFYRFQANRRLTHSAEVVLGRLEREIRGAKSIDLASDLSNGQLILKPTVATGDDIEFFLDDTTLKIKEGSGTYASSTDDRTVVGELIFSSVGTAGIEAVKIELELLDNGLVDTSAKFYSTVVLRGSY